MANTRISHRNIACPEPKWFRRLKNAASIGSNTAVVLLLAAGYSDDSFSILIVRVGLSGLMSFVGALLSDKEI